MQVTSTVALLLAVAASATASPVIEARGPEITLCKNQDLADCQTFGIPASACWNFPADLNDVVSSVDTGGASCTFYVDGSCGGASWEAEGSHPTVPAKFNDQFSSVRC